MPTLPPSRCPFCESQDIRRLPSDGDELVGYRCHQCDRIFYVAAVRIQQVAPKVR